ncbi:MAG: hypothetical protein ABDH18_00485 [Aquificaceae bacterium]
MKNFIVAISLFLVSSLAFLASAIYFSNAEHRKEVIDKHKKRVDKKFEQSQ